MATVYNLPSTVSSIPSLDETPHSTYPNPIMRSLILSIIQIVLAALLVTTVLLQQRGTSLGAAFGGGSDVFRTKRGIEKGLFYATIVLAVLFFVTAILNVALT